MAHIAGLVELIGIDRQLFAIEAVETVITAAFEARVIEYEKLKLRAEIGGVANAGILQIGLGAFGSRARIAAIGLAGGRFDHVAEDYQRWLRGEGIDKSGASIR